jgi:pyruvate dehydrogenase E2 component (dihydrolipoamide acetyltransferase)
MATEVYMSKMSDHMESGEIVKWLVTEGSVVSEGQALVEIETDKASAEISAPARGVLRIRAGVEPGAIVRVGETIAFVMDTADEVVPERSSLTEEGKFTQESTSNLAAHGSIESNVAPREEIRVSRVQGNKPILGEQQNSLLNEDGGNGVVVPHRVRASPAAQRMAREAGVSLSEVRGTGPAGIISEKDVRAYLQSLRGHPYA